MCPQTGVRDVITANHHLFPPIEHGKGVAEKMVFFFVQNPFIFCTSTQVQILTQR
jgi:hypothetical protein